MCVEGKVPTTTARAESVVKNVFKEPASVSMSFQRQGVWGKKVCRAFLPLMRGVYAKI